MLKNISLLSNLSNCVNTISIYFLSFLRKWCWGVLVCACKGFGINCQGGYLNRIVNSTRRKLFLIVFKIADSKIVNGYGQLQITHNYFRNYLANISSVADNCLEPYCVVNYKFNFKRFSFLVKINAELLNTLLEHWVELAWIEILLITNYNSLPRSLGLNVFNEQRCVASPSSCIRAWD